MQTWSKCKETGSSEQPKGMNHFILQVPLYSGVMHLLKDKTDTSTYKKKATQSWGKKYFYDLSYGQIDKYNTIYLKQYLKKYSYFVIYTY